MNTLYQLKISLKNTNPLIWRRVLVSSDCTLKQLHEIIQVCFAWNHSHLYAFNMDRVVFDNEYPKLLAMRLDQLNLTPKHQLTYIYDFGDDWEHTIQFEESLSPNNGQIYPVCLFGECAAPPEDSGGVYGYKEKLKAWNDKNHPEHLDAVAWLGDDFRPSHIDTATINRQLNKLG